jgi:hypothetical protein
MNQLAVCILLFLLGVALSFYGWWCLFHTDSAIKFGWNPLMGERGNWFATKLHGVISLLLGPSICVFCLAHFLGASWARFG